jgi:hypothetical protein
MLDFLFTWGQVLCLAGYVYGAYLMMTHSDAFRSNDRKDVERFTWRRNPDEERLLRRFLHSDG